MDRDFWLERWQKDEIGFHEPDGNPFLKKYVGLLETEGSPCIFIPLCGKTKDIDFLLTQGYSVIGVELSEMAVRQVFSRLGRTPVMKVIDSFKLYAADNLQIFVGDIFDLQPHHVTDISATYDRAALIALPAKMRQRYAHQVIQITQAAPQLLLTFNYPQALMQGPPFAVNEAEVNALYSSYPVIELLDEKQVSGGLKRQVEAQALVFWITHKG